MMRHITYYDRNKRGKKRNRYDQSKRHRLAVDRTEPMVGRILRNHFPGMQATILLLHKSSKAPSAHHILVNRNLLLADIYTITVRTLGQGSDLIVGIAAYSPDKITNCEAVLVVINSAIHERNDRHG